MYGGFSIEVDLTHEDAVRLTLHGELDMSSTDEVRAFLAGLQAGQESPTLVVDTTRLWFIDSRGVGVLVEARNRIGPENFVLIPGDATIRVLEAAGIKEQLTGD